MRFRPVLLLSLLAFALAGCAHQPASTAPTVAPTLTGDPAHPGATKGWVDTKLYFGLGPADHPEQGISEAQWREFRERYANNILWISALDMILMSWDVTEKKTYRDGGMLYRSKYPAARVWQRFVVNAGCESGSCMSGRSACVSRKKHHLSLSRCQLHRH